MGKALQPRLRFAPARVQIERRADGAMILRSPLKLGGHARAVGEWLERWARENPERTFPAERRDGARQKLGYREALAPVRPAGQGCLARGIGPGTIAKILFTSGSTGTPKGVINTQRMLTVNQEQYACVWPFLEDRPQVLVDWLPWNHTFGGNNNFGMMLRNGGTFHIDGGKPAPGLIEITVGNLREVSPTVYFNVPRGFDLLMPFLEKDAALRGNFFRNLDLMVYAGASLPQNLWERMQALALAERGVRLPLISAWGSTETAPMATGVHYAVDRAGIIGLPVPGCELKLVPSGGKLEARVKGPNVTPGYWGRDDLTKAAFDDEGYYRIGDALKFADPARPERR